MKRITSQYVFLILALGALSGCGGDAPHADTISGTELNGDDFNSNSTYPRLNTSLISISGTLNTQGEGLIVALGKFGSVYSPTQNNFTGTNLRLNLKQDNLNQDFALLIEANSSDQMGFNSDTNGNPKYAALNFGSLNPSLPISFVIYFGDIPLVTGQFYLK
ncbi:MAG: hypothetical protein J0L93_09690 [Deltaproteobacteria bacterium]|nr:hypothetical protein [Deltaproteobacteria bacterium]